MNIRGAPYPQNATAAACTASSEPSTRVPRKRPIECWMKLLFHSFWGPFQSSSDFKMVLNNFLKIWEFSEKYHCSTHAENLHRDRNLHCIDNFRQYIPHEEPHDTTGNLDKTFGQTTITISFNSQPSTVESIYGCWPAPTASVSRPVNRQPVFRTGIRLTVTRRLTYRSTWGTPWGPWASGYRGSEQARDGK